MLSGGVNRRGVEAGKGAIPAHDPVRARGERNLRCRLGHGNRREYEDYQTPFAFDGKLNSLTIKLMPEG